MDINKNVTLAHEEHHLRNFWGGKVKHEFRYMSYEFKFTSYEFKSMSYELKPTSYKLKSTR